MKKYLSFVSCPPLACQAGARDNTYSRIQIFYRPVSLREIIKQSLNFLYFFGVLPAIKYRCDGYQVFIFPVYDLVIAFDKVSEIFRIMS